MPEFLLMTVITERIKQWKLWLVTLAIGISGVSLFISHTLITDLYNEEVGKMSVWAEAMRSLTVADETTDLSLVLQVINSNNTIPVVVTDKQGNILATRNLSPEPHGKDSLAMLDIAVADMKRHGKTMRMDCTTKGSAVEDHIDIFYEESVMLRRLSVYPYVQLGVVSFFVLVCILALLASKRAEQNRVWVGLSRETAHQLGTPISSLMAWSEMLKETYPDDPLLQKGPFSPSLIVMQICPSPCMASTAFLQRFSMTHSKRGALICAMRGTGGTEHVNFTFVEVRLSK